jgi:hypothetical protein
MFFVKISNLTNTGNLEHIVINLERVTLVNRGHRRINDVDKEICTIAYDVGGGSVTSFTVDCTLEQFHNFMEYVFSCTTAIGSSLTEFLKQPKFTVGDTVKVTDPIHSHYGKVGYVAPKLEYVNHRVKKNDSLLLVQFTTERHHELYLLHENQLEHFNQEDQKTDLKDNSTNIINLRRKENPSCNGNGKAQSTEE